MRQDKPWLWQRLALLCLLLTATLALQQPSWAAQPPSSELSGDVYGETWRAASAEEKLAYCRKAYIALRSAPSQSYIISSNVQAISPEGFCKRLDRFYSFEIDLETPLSEAAAIAPLLFADVPME
ncbi:hypothetical protein [Synechococcus sp. PCC 7336]|uniref:hypothetical protein n=1 Tax=Synechococcus sp. PCC 7336 TaxID=195250 RepID=UPI00034C78B1|nr:hypothetical protein [Synechococcus sp. PCC 7336]